MRAYFFAPATIAGRLKEFRGFLGCLIVAGAGAKLTKQYLITSTPRADRRTPPLGRVPYNNIVLRRDAEGAHHKVRDRVAPLRGEREAVAVDNRLAGPPLPVVRRQLVAGRAVARARERLGLVRAEGPAPDRRLG